MAGIGDTEQMRAFGGVGFVGGMPGEIEDADADGGGGDGVTQGRLCDAASRQRDDGIVAVGGDHAHDARRQAAEHAVERRHQRARAASGVAVAMATARGRHDDYDAGGEDGREREDEVAHGERGDESVREAADASVATEDAQDDDVTDDGDEDDDSEEREHEDALGRHAGGQWRRAWPQGRVAAGVHLAEVTPLAGHRGCGLKTDSVMLVNVQIKGCVSLFHAESFLCQKQGGSDEARTSHPSVCPSVRPSVRPSASPPVPSPALFLTLKSVCSVYYLISTPTPSRLYICGCL